MITTPSYLEFISVYKIFVPCLPCTWHVLGVGNTLSKSKRDQIPVPLVIHSSCREIDSNAINKDLVCSQVVSVTGK